MCGFAGLLRWTGLAPDDAENVRAAASMLAHRGPDSAGFHADAHIALGFQRLKIIDLSPAGDQPMSNEDGTLWVVFNGEIYNYKELREELVKQGHTFKSRSDTEVLLHLYEQHGEEMLPKLRGMFAFAIWNAREQKLFLARDPLGVKPLYFAERQSVPSPPEREGRRESGRIGERGVRGAVVSSPLEGEGRVGGRTGQDARFIAFASEPKALFALGIQPEIDPVAIHEALTYRYVPAPRSGFKDVEKLPPGNLAIAENGTLRYRKWWSVATDPDESVSREAYEKHNKERWAEAKITGAKVRIASYQDWLASQTAKKLQPAAARRLISDVPLGAWLSGGIDSGLVLSKMGENVHTFSAGFASPEYDERALARTTASHLKSQHAEFEIPADVFHLLPQIVWHCDEPYFDSSTLPTFVLAEKTKPHATVVLSGDGGDEAFAGYDRYIGMQLFERYKKTPAIFRKLALWYANWRYPAATRQGWDRMLRWLEKCRLMEASGHHPYLAAMELFSEEQKAELYADDFAEQVDGADAREVLENALMRAQENCSNDFSRSDRGDAKDPGTTKVVTTTSTGVLQRADLETYLSGDVLHKVDRMSMAHGVEVRSPFLDVDLVNFALSLPDDVRLPGRQTKPLLRQAAAAVLPPEVVHARKKGFGVPLDDWFRGPLQKIALSLFEDSHLAGDKIFKPRFWEKLWQEHQQQKAQHGERLYALLSLEVWYRMFISGPVPKTRPEALK
jgi:asparagine synthase (glutamine-hydrolysing)